MNSSFGSLQRQIVQTTEAALACGALQPIATQIQTVMDGDIQFCVRVVDSLVRKAAVHKARTTSSEKRSNPFLPYEEALCVGNLSATHVCLLNKFKVVDHHILMVTRTYESQDDWLTIADFEALAFCLIEIDGLGFYNGGQQAGASQHHKHLQLVPFSPQQGIQDLPIAPFIAAQQEEVARSGYLAALPFIHRIQFLAIQWSPGSLSKVAQILFKTYQQLLTALNVSLTDRQPSIPYNLLITREWMMVILRSQEASQDIGVNSLGYSGWLLVKTVKDLERLKQIGPLNLLRQTGYLAEQG
ncbi:MAG: phosphorylase [Cyanobacteria bacterium P01_H01_bin.58]